MKVVCACMVFWREFLALLVDSPVPVSCLIPPLNLVLTHKPRIPSPSAGFHD